MPTFNLSITCEDADELAKLVALLGGKSPKPADDDEEKPAKGKAGKAADDDDDEEKPKGKKKADPRETIREKLRELSEKTDRKTAVKLLNKYAESVDEVDEGDLEELLGKVEAAIEAAE